MKLLRSLFGSAQPARIPDALWRSTLAAYPFLAALPPSDADALKALAERFLAEKELDAAGGLVLENAARVSIAAQAALPILRLGIEYYRGWTGVLVYPDEFIIPRQVTDADGVVHAYDEEAAGEAWDGGPVILSWADAAPNDIAGYNVVIHEFAHKIDLLSGDASGIPPLHRDVGCSVDAWTTVLIDSYDDFLASVEAAEASVPRHVDPESETADRYFVHLPLDAYAATDPGEFFAVSSEAFFVHPWPLKTAYPAWYELLARFYRQDPSTRLAAS